MSMSKSSMSVSANSIDRFLNFAVKLRNRKFNPTGIGNEGDGLVAVIYVFLGTCVANTFCQKFYSGF